MEHSPYIAAVFGPVPGPPLFSFFSLLIFSFSLPFSCNCFLSFVGSPSFVDFTGPVVPFIYFFSSFFFVCPNSFVPLFGLFVTFSEPFFSVSFPLLSLMGFDITSLFLFSVLSLVFPTLFSASSFIRSAVNLAPASTAFAAAIAVAPINTIFEIISILNSKFIHRTRAK